VITIHEIPALRLFLITVAAILLYPVIEPILNIWILIALILTSVLLGWISLIKKQRYNLRYLYGIFTSSLWFTGTLLLLFAGNHFLQKDSLLREVKNGHLNGKTMLYATCTSIPQIKKTAYFTIKVKLWQNGNNEWQKSTALVQIFSADTAIVTKLQPGTQLILKSNLSLPLSPKNPGEFDYRDYLASQHIYLQGFCKVSDITVLHSNTKTLTNWIYPVRKSILDKINRLLNYSEEADLASALLIGYRDRINETTNDQFVQTGSVHLLAVSGMHVVLIYSNILLFFSLLKINKIKNLQAIAAIILVWIFTGIAGFAPSVVRAATMLSLLVAGKILNRHAHPFNTVFAGAWLMLLYEPNILFDVGFQLSLSAVIGIIGCKNWIDSKLPLLIHRFPTVRDLISVTLAAQIGTLPFIMYYFHQFPVYFLLSGLAAVIISDLIIKIGIIVLILAYLVWPVAIKIAFLWKGLITLLLFIISSISKLPGPLIDRIYCSKSMFILGLLSLVIFLVAIQQKKAWSKSMLVILLMLLVLDFTHFISYRNQNELVVYDAGKYRLIEIQKGFRSILIADSLLPPRKIKQICQNYQICNAVSSSIRITIQQRQNIQFISQHLDSTLNIDALISQKPIPNHDNIYSTKKIVSGFIEKTNPAIDRVIIYN
jgi:competence protein ComEC